MKVKFTAAQFTPTKWDTAEQKAAFANHFVRFVESGFKETLFTKSFYNQLSITFGHIAHYNQHGFFSEFFTTSADKLRFIEHTLTGGGFGDPTFTYCDVERAIKAWVIKAGLLEKARKENESGIEQSERAELARLKSKYERAA